MESLKILSSEYQAKNLAVKLNAKGEKSVVKGHPWVFENSIAKINDNAETGDLAIIFSKNKNRVIGIGLYDADSPIRIKMIHHAEQKAVIDSAFFKNKIEEAFQKRLPLLQSNTNSYRMLFGENDGFPGLIADVYAHVLVVKLYSEIWFPFLEMILEHLRDISNTETIIIRLSRKLHNSKAHNLKDGEVVYGHLKSEVVHFLEHGVQFSANVIKGHKTGYFLDHRENRRLVGEMSKGKSVLDVFSYAGGFSVHALAKGSEEVTSLDISQQALEVAQYNAQLNSHKGIHKTIVGDAFIELENLINRKKTFDVVVIDPPSFAKKQSEVELAKKKYAQLASLGVKLTSKKGTLVLASCSSRVTAKAFFDINDHYLSISNRKYSVLFKNLHDVDHPVTFPEGAYLKCGYYQFED